MITLAVTHELRSIFRSPARLLALAVFAAAYIYATMAGQRFCDDWQQAVVAAQAQQRDQADKAIQWLKNGEKGPKDRPWIDISSPFWQDRYAGTRAVRTPLALSGIAFGAVDESPVVIQVNRAGNPFAAAGMRIENPELDRSSSVDLVFVFVVIVPLALGVLGLGIGSFEREQSIDRLITAQCGAASSWFFLRAAVVTSVTLMSVLIAGSLVCWTMGARLSDSVAFLLLSASYTLFWGGILAIVSVSATQVYEGAFAYGMLWVLLCVLIPVLLSELAISRQADNYAVDVSLGARAERYETYDREAAELIPELYEAFPNLATMRAATDELKPELRRHVYDGILVLALEKRHAQVLKEERRAANLARGGVWLSPAVALAYGFENLAGLGAEPASDFRGHVVDAIKQRVNWVLTRAWQLKPLGLADFEALLEKSGAPYSAAAKASSATPPLAIGLWAIIAWAVAFIRTR